MKSLVFVLTSIFLIHTGCKKVTECKDGLTTTHSYDLPVTVSPLKDFYSIGDTIWIEQLFSDKILNNNYGEYFSIENFNFKTYYSITDLNTPASSTTYVNPNIITYIGSTDLNSVISESYQSINVQYDYSENVYRYKAAFIPDKAGLYALGYGTHLLEDEVDITKCRTEYIYLTYNTNNRTADNNYEFLKNAKDEHYASLPKKKFDDYGGFCFYVK